MIAAESKQSSCCSSAGTECSKKHVRFQLPADGEAICDSPDSRTQKYPNPRCCRTAPEDRRNVLMKDEYIGVKFLANNMRRRLNARKPNFTPKQADDLEHVYRWKTVTETMLEETAIPMFKERLPAPTYERKADMVAYFNARLENKPQDWQFPSGWDRVQERPYYMVKPDYTVPDPIIMQRKQVNSAWTYPGYAGYIPNTIPKVLLNKEREPKSLITTTSRLAYNADEKLNDTDYSRNLVAMANSERIASMNCCRNGNYAGYITKYVPEVMAEKGSRFSGLSSVTKTVHRRFPEELYRKRMTPRVSNLSKAVSLVDPHNPFNVLQQGSGRFSRGNQLDQVSSIDYMDICKPKEIEIKD